jgi:hypothetical protein
MTLRHPTEYPEASRYVYIDSAPNNALLRCFGIWDSEADDYARLPDGTYCFGMTAGEADSAIAHLTAPEMAS